MRLWCLPVCLSLALVACTPGAGSNTSTTAVKPGLATRNGTSDIDAVANRAKAGVAVKLTSIRGKVLAPGGYKAGYGAPKEGESLPPVDKDAKGTGTDTGEGSLEGKALAGVEVFLAARDGRRFKGPSVGKTDINGSFEIKGVPEDLMFLLLSDTQDPAQRHTEICAMARQAGDGKPFDITLSTTIVTLGTIRNAGAGAITSLMGAIDFTFYFKAVAAVDLEFKKLKVKDLPNLNDPAAIQAFLNTIKLDGTPLGGAMDKLRDGLNKGIDANATQAILDQIGQIQIAGQGSVTSGGTTNAGGGSITLDPTKLPGIDLGALGFGLPQATPAPAEPDPTPEPVQATPTPTPSVAAPSTAPSVTPSAAASP